MKITIVAGARPNFMKIAPIIHEIHLAQKRHEDIEYRLVHTGQHYDKTMSGDFFDELGIPKPDINLAAGSGSQSEQTAAIMIGFEKELEINRPNVVLVVGDVTSTMAASITAKKMFIDVVHVEAGLRSGDMKMPEEINRIITDAISDHFFTTTEMAGHQLRRSGLDKSKIHFVGNTMIDTLNQNLHRLKEPAIWSRIALCVKGYYLITLHRPSNVDDVHDLKNLLDVILNNTGDVPVIFPVHPRTKKVLDLINYSNNRLVLVDPMCYLEFIFLIKNAKAVITDSGGITEETTVLKVPCLTLRDSTERPETVIMGSNELVGTDPANLIPFLIQLKDGHWKESGIPKLWDGKTAKRIIDKLLELYAKEPFPARDEVIEALSS